MRQEEIEEIQVGTLAFGFVGFACCFDQFKDIEWWVECCGCACRLNYLLFTCPRSMQAPF